MKIETKYFGEIEVDENLLIKFEEGIPGFEYLKEFALIDIENKSYKCIQSIKEKNICLLAIYPWDYFKDYEIKLSDSEIEYLEIEDEKQVLVFNVITAREKNITANLVAPIVINIKNKKAKQIILPNTKYSLREVIKCLY